MIEGQTRYVKQIWTGSEWAEYHVYDDIDSKNIEYLEQVILCSMRFCPNTTKTGIFIKSLSNKPMSKPTTKDDGEWRYTNAIKDTQAAISKAKQEGRDKCETQWQIIIKLSNFIAEIQYILEQKAKDIDCGWIGGKSPPVRDIKFHINSILDGFNDLVTEYEIYELIKLARERLEA